MKKKRPQKNDFRVFKKVPKINRMKRSLLIISMILMPWGHTIYSQDVLSSNNDSSVELFKKGKKYFFEKKYDAASEIMQNIIKKQPNHAEALSILGDIYLFKNDFYKALDFYKRAEPLSASPAIENFRMGQIYIKQDKPDDAIQSFQRALEFKPSMKISLYQIGYVELVLKRDKGKTITTWRRFLDESPYDKQNEKIRSALKCLEDPNFKLPQRNEDASLEDALLFCGVYEASSENISSETAGHEEVKTDNTTRGLIEDDDL